ncbi:hypothetical protein D9619_004004 [Psilocybe cf. subviscida]|uniref:G domain-containing protein n=1 Tax=Psilocybe cf. subviscida TaxID=2480587 RepID=A0A8H5BNI9_9AGAR|nr:hypothetical protein D9619_004004 [Psilocybe cf. subviscida]
MQEPSTIINLFDRSPKEYDSGAAQLSSPYLYQVQLLEIDASVLRLLGFLFFSFSSCNMTLSTDSTAAFQDETRVLSIAVMGPTGTGKSSFINMMSGSHLQVGKHLESCTSDVQISDPFELDGQVINLIDTPGFDDTTLSEHSVLNLIAAFLSKSYDQGKRLAGVVYLHRILDNRVGGISARSFRLFRSLCGEPSLRSVIIATTMWDAIEEPIGSEREKELCAKDIFFKPALARGARMTRYHNTLESGREILRAILKQGRDAPVALQIQEELHSGMQISETRAGQELGRELFEQMERHRVEMHGLLEEIQRATQERDDESKHELNEERRRLELTMSKMQIDTAGIVAGYRDALGRMEERLRLAEAAAQMFKQSHPLAGFASNRRTTPEAPKGPDDRSMPEENSSYAPIVQAVAATENSNAVLEGKLAAAIPIVGLWGKLAVMLAPFSLTWR